MQLWNDTLLGRVSILSGTRRLLGPEDGFVLIRREQLYAVAVVARHVVSATVAHGRGRSSRSGARLQCIRVY